MLEQVAENVWRYTENRTAAEPVANVTITGRIQYLENAVERRLLLGPDIGVRTEILPGHRKPVKNFRNIIDAMARWSALCLSFQIHMVSAFPSTCDNKVAAESQPKKADSPKGGLS